MVEYILNSLGTGINSKVALNPLLFFFFFYYHIAYVKRYSSLHTVQILTILMTQIFSITYRAPKDIHLQYSYLHSIQ